MASYKAKNYRFCPSLSLGGTFPDVGFESDFVQCSAYSTMLISYSSNRNTTLNVYKTNVRNATNREKIFSKLINADVKFMRRFPITSNFIQIEVVNEQSLEGTIALEGSLSSSAQMNSHHYTNSIIDDNDDLNLVRIANDFEDDVVRGAHLDIDKITINGILDVAPSVEETIGLTDNYRYDQTSSTANIVVASTNDVNGGTGARTLLVEGVKGDGTRFSTTLLLAHGTSSTGIEMMSIDTMEVSSVGSLFHNDGNITINGAGGDILGFIPANKNIALNGYYKVPLNKTLVINNLNICGIVQGGTIKIVKYNPSTNMEQSVGEFVLDSSFNQINYPLNISIDSLNVIKFNYNPTGFVGSSFKLNICCNAVQYKILNDF
jgi:hypothetical protein